MGMNPGASGNVDLIYSGDLERGLTLNKVLNVGFSIFSTDYKAQHIAEKYGLDVYGLSDEELEDLFEMVAGRVIIEIFNKSW